MLVVWIFLAASCRRLGTVSCGFDFGEVGGSGWALFRTSPHLTGGTTSIPTSSRVLFFVLDRKGMESKATHSWERTR